MVTIFYMVILTFRISECVAQTYNSCRFPDYLYLVDTGGNVRSWITSVRQDDRPQRSGEPVVVVMTRITVFNDGKVHWQNTSRTCQNNRCGVEQLGTRTETILCVREIVSATKMDTFIVKKQTGSTGKWYYGCFVFQDVMRRTANGNPIISFTQSSSFLDWQNERLCSSDFISETGVRTMWIASFDYPLLKWVPCPIIGGFKFALLKRDGSEINCKLRHWMHYSHLESECVVGEGMEFQYRHSDCSPFGEPQLVEDQVSLDKFRCYGSWIERTRDANIAHVIIYQSGNEGKLFTLRYNDNNLRAGLNTSIHIVDGAVEVTSFENMPQDIRYYSGYIQKHMSQFPDCDDQHMSCSEVGRRGCAAAPAIGPYCRTTCKTTCDDRSGRMYGREIPEMIEGYYRVFDKHESVYGSMVLKPKGVGLINISSPQVVYDNRALQRTSQLKCTKRTMDMSKRNSPYEGNIFQTLYNDNGCRSRELCMELFHVPLTKSVNDDGRNPNILFYRIGRSQMKANVMYSEALCRFDEEPFPQEIAFKSDQFRAGINTKLIEEYDISSMLEWRCNVFRCVDNAIITRNNQTCSIRFYDWNVTSREYGNEVVLEKTSTCSFFKAIPSAHKCIAVVEPKSFHAKYTISNYMMLHTVAQVGRMRKFYCWLRQIGTDGKIRWYVFQSPQCGVEIDVTDEGRIKRIYKADAFFTVEYISDNLAQSRCMTVLNTRSQQPKKPNQSIDKQAEDINNEKSGLIHRPKSRKQTTKDDPNRTTALYHITTLPIILCLFFFLSVTFT